MNRFAFVLLLAGVWGAPLGNLSQGDEPESPNAPAAVSPEETLKENPNDTAALNAYMSQKIPQLIALINTNPADAEKQLAEVREFIGSLKPEEEAAKQLVERANTVLKAYEQRLEIARTTLEELAEKLKANPDDRQTLTLYIQKVSQEVSPLIRIEPFQAEEQLNNAKAFLAEVESQAEEDVTKKAIQSSLQTFARLEQGLEAGKKMAALIGQDAAPLQVQAWANGAPLTDADLEGKVVLLDFWAVWCGPCIATFPHLRHWQEKYADKGLVIIGLTRYYNYNWDDEAGRATRSQESVSSEQELEMLDRFAEQHKLQHRFAIQEGKALSEYYNVSGIPHVVLIDRQGKVRLMRVGSGEQNAKAIEQMLEELIGDQT